MTPTRPLRCLAVAALVAAASCARGDGGGRAATTAAPTSSPATETTPPPTTAPPPPPPTTAAPATTRARPAPTPAPRPAPTPAPAPPPSSGVRLVQVARLDQPLTLAVRAGDDALYVAEKGGRVRALRGGAVDPAPVLDVSGDVSTGYEQGLLGLAFSPAGTHLYVNYTNRQGDTRVVEYAVRDGRADPGSRRELLAVDQPFANHNGGHLGFGPDGLLYVALGDGGSGNDPMDNGQRLDTLLGKLLRIDPRPSAGQPYTIPPGNPFAGRPGTRPEIWAYGLRNPWRFSFDRATRDLWTADVGQNAREEVNRVPASSTGGENYGWARLEGTRPVRGARPQGAVDPVFEYPTSGGNCAVTGGYVYRGTQVPALQGTYVFGDFCRGELLGLPAGGGGRLQATALGLRVPNLSSFGEDHGGEVYALSLGGAVLRLAPGG